MARPGCDTRRHFQATAYLRQRATGMKAASGRRTYRAWDFARQDVLVAPQRGVGNRNRVEQCFRVGMQRGDEECIARCKLDDSAKIHDSEAMADGLHHRELV